MCLREIQSPPSDIDEYIPFIRFLYEKRDDIYQLLSGTKAIYMSDMIAKLAGEFSKEKNITQRMQHQQEMKS